MTLPVLDDLLLESIDVSIPRSIIGTFPPQRVGRNIQSGNSFSRPAFNYHFR